MLRVSRGISGAAAVLTLAALSIPARAAIPAAPGVVNYIEGAASIDGQPITSKDIGRAEVKQNQTLATGQGKVEMLLTTQPPMMRSRTDPAFRPNALPRPKGSS